MFTPPKVHSGSLYLKDLLETGMENPKYAPYRDVLRAMRDYYVSSTQFDHLTSFPFMPDAVPFEEMGLSSERKAELMDDDNFSKMLRDLCSLSRIRSVYFFRDLEYNRPRKRKEFVMNEFQKRLEELNAEIWEASELRFREFRSAAALVSFLREEGFEVTEGVADMPTAFIARAGSGRPAVGLLAEYDALSGLSQKAGVTWPEPVEGRESGHGCGHSLFGTGIVEAAVLLRNRLREEGREGTVVVYGCPAEEGGSGKAYMARAGLFDEVDAAITWHPSTMNEVVTGSSNANCQAYFRFKGVSAHAAGAPQKGRSALDAVELMNVGVNYLREHMEQEARIHYAVLDTGGTSPNVVQSHAEVLYLVRHVNVEKALALYERVCDVARGAAMMTGTKVEIAFDKACSDLLPNEPLEKLLYECMLAEKLPEYTEEEQEFGRKMQETVISWDPAESRSVKRLPAALREQTADRLREKPFPEFVMPYFHFDTVSSAGSTDVGDTSYAVPTGQIHTATFAVGCPGHSWQYTAQGKSSTALKAMDYAARVMALAGYRLMTEPDRLADAKEDFRVRTGGKPYHCAIPAELLPGRPR